MTSRGLTPRQAATKRALDLLIAGVGIVGAAPVIAAGWLVATLSTGVNGFYRQERIGLHGESFTLLKIRTMRVSGGTSVTTLNDARITRAGALLRKLKIDELPQLMNVLRGEMSLVGPRPDVPGFADQLLGDDRIILSVRPGITGPAAVAYRHEESMLSTAEDPETFNREVIWPDKVRINRDYVENWSLRSDLRCLLATVESVFGDEKGTASA
jgi:lipopolysaccharide/colanic/teichoic acid biosynthesis glycosyltransferase